MDPKETLDPAAVIDPAATVVDPAATPAVDSAPAAEPVPAIETHTETASFLTKPAADPAAAAAADPVAVDPAAAADPAAVDPAAAPADPAAAAAADPAAAAADPAAAAAVQLEPLVYEPPTLPEGVTLNAERIAEFDGVIGAHQLPPEARQQLVDMFVAERGQWEKDSLAEQHRQFAVTRQGWRDQIFGDEELGGAAKDTTQAAAMRMIDLFVGDKHRGEWEGFLLATGAGDHPALTRLLNTLAKKFDAAPVPVPPNNPAPDRGGANGRGKRMRDMYDHPRSAG